MLLPDKLFKPASALRSPAEVVRAQVDLFRSNCHQQVLNALPGPVLVFNTERQIVFCNQAFLDLTGKSLMEEVCGMGFGEAFDCECALECAAEGGCGTAERCTACDFLQALERVRLGRQQGAICSVTRIEGGRRRGLNLEMSATPLQVEGKTFTLVCAVDRSGEVVRQAWERLHQEQIRPGLQLLAGNSGRDMQAVASWLQNATAALEWLAAAEAGTLPVFRQPGSSLAAAQRALERLAYNPALRGRGLDLDPASADVQFSTDQRLLAWVLAALLENALEAVPAGARPKLSVTGQGDGVEFQVHNAGVIPEAVRLRIPARAFSTKSPARGYGLYLGRLIAEEYLGGELAFQTNRESGTVFTVRLPLS